MAASSRDRQHLYRLAVYIGLVGTCLGALYLVQWHEEARLRHFQIRKCHTDNALRRQLREQGEAQLQILKLFSDRTRVGLAAIPPALLQRVEASLARLPGPDQNCDGVPGPGTKGNR